MQAKTKVLRGTAALGLGLLLWSTVNSFGGFLLGGHERAHKHTEAPRQQRALPEQARARISSLEGQLEQNPDSAELRTELGYALLTHGLATGEGGELIAALKQFDEALKLNPDEPRALLGIAGISLRVGVYEKAVEYYERYLKKAPENVQALSDYGLALARLERLDDARAVLARARGIEGGSIPVLMVSAMVEEQAQAHAEARRFAEQALARAEDDTTAASIQAFIAELETQGGNGESAPADVKDAPSAALREARQYFAEHPIIGPKLRRVIEREERLVLYVHDFPVEAMPPVARDRFSANVNERLSAFKGELQAVDIVEDGTNTPLMRIELE